MDGWSCAGETVVAHHTPHHTSPAPARESYTGALPVTVWVLLFCFFSLHLHFLLSGFSARSRVYKNGRHGGGSMEYIRTTAPTPGPGDPHQNGGNSIVDEVDMVGYHVFSLHFHLSLSCSSFSLVYSFHLQATASTIPPSMIPPDLARYLNWHLFFDFFYTVGQVRTLDWNQGSQTPF